LQIAVLLWRDLLANSNDFRPNDHQPLHRVMDLGTESGFRDYLAAMMSLPPSLLTALSTMQAFASALEESSDAHAKLRISGAEVLLHATSVHCETLLNSTGLMKEVCVTGTTLLEMLEPNDRTEIWQDDEPFTFPHALFHDFFTEALVLPLLGSKDEYFAARYMCCFVRTAAQFDSAWHRHYSSPDLHAMFLISLSVMENLPSLCLEGAELASRILDCKPSSASWINGHVANVVTIMISHLERLSRKHMEVVYSPVSRASESARLAEILVLVSGILQRWHNTHFRWSLSLDQDLSVSLEKLLGLINIQNIPPDLLMQLGETIPSVINVAMTLLLLLLIEAVFEDRDYEKTPAPGFLRNLCKIIKHTADYCAMNSVTSLYFPITYVYYRLLQASKLYLITESIPEAVALFHRCIAPGIVMLHACGAPGIDQDMNNDGIVLMLSFSPDHFVHNGKLTDCMGVLATHLRDPSSLSLANMVLVWKKHCLYPGEFDTSEICNRFYNLWEVCAKSDDILRYRVTLEVEQQLLDQESTMPPMFLRFWKNLLLGNDTSCKWALTMGAHWAFTSRLIEYCAVGTSLVMDEDVDNVSGDWELWADEMEQHDSESFSVLPSYQRWKTADTLSERWPLLTWSALLVNCACVETLCESAPKLLWYLAEHCSHDGLSERMHDIVVEYSQGNLHRLQQVILQQGFPHQADFYMRQSITSLSFLLEFNHLTRLLSEDQSESACLLVPDVLLSECLNAAAFELQTTNCLPLNVLKWISLECFPRVQTSRKHHWKPRRKALWSSLREPLGVLRQSLRYIFPIYESSPSINDSLQLSTHDLSELMHAVALLWWLPFNSEDRRAWWQAIWEDIQQEQLLIPNGRFSWFVSLNICLLAEAVDKKQWKLEGVLEQSDSSQIEKDLRLKYLLEMSLRQANMPAVCCLYFLTSLCMRHSPALHCLASLPKMGEQLLQQLSKTATITIDNPACLLAEKETKDNIWPMQVCNDAIRVFFSACQSDEASYWNPSQQPDSERPPAIQSSFLLPLAVTQFLDVLCRHDGFCQHFSQQSAGIGILWSCLARVLASPESIYWIKLVTTITSILWTCSTTGQCLDAISEAHTQYPTVLDALLQLEPPLLSLLQNLSGLLANIAHLPMIQSIVSASPNFKCIVSWIEKTDCNLQVQWHVMRIAAHGLTSAVNAACWLESNLLPNTLDVLRDSKPKRSHVALNVLAALGSWQATQLLTTLQNMTAQNGQEEGESSSSSHSSPLFRLMEVLTISLPTYDQGQCQDALSLCSSLAASHPALTAEWRQTHASWEQVLRGVETRFPTDSHLTRQIHSLLH
jgi:hypothetical protein